MEIRPDSAVVECDGKTETVDPFDVRVGEIIVVRPGEKIPLDGVIIEGSSSINTVALTGESAPGDVSVGDSVMSGCVNLTGLLRIKVSREFQESTVSKILELVENSGANKSKKRKFYNKVCANIYADCSCCGLLYCGCFTSDNGCRGYFGMEKLDLPCDVAFS